ncbi:hypothetical protein [Streptomyces virginiae]
MLHTVLRRWLLGESVEQIQSDLIRPKRSIGRCERHGRPVRS